MAFFHCCSCPISPSAMMSSVYVRKSHSALPWVCVSLLQNNKKTNPLFSSLPSSSSSSPLLPGQTDKWNTQRVWSWALLSYNSLVFFLSVCWFSPAPQTIRWWAILSPRKDSIHNNANAGRGKQPHTQHARSSRVHTQHFWLALLLVLSTSGINVNYSYMSVWATRTDW